MINKRMNIFYYVLGGLVILLGLLMFRATRDIPLPSNAKKEGNMIHIDLSEGAINEAEKKEALFKVSEKYKPHVTESSFYFYFKYPEGTPYTGYETPVPYNRVRVDLGHSIKPEALLSEYVLRKTQPKDGPLSTPWFLESKDGLNIYKYSYGGSELGTYFKFVTKEGKNIVIDDPGSWSRVYKVYTKLSSHMELDYLFNKNLVRGPAHFIEDVPLIDKAALKLVQSFQSK